MRWTEEGSVIRARSGKALSVMWGAWALSLRQGGDVRGVHPGLWHDHCVLGRSLWSLLEEGLGVWEIIVETGTWPQT